MESGKNDRELRGFNCSLLEVLLGIIPGTAAWRYLHNKDHMVKQWLKCQCAI